MAGSSVEPDRVANQPAANSNQAVGANTVGVRTALWAVGVTLLSNVANILKQLQDAMESVRQIEQFITDHMWISVVLLGGAAIWGNALLFRFLYHRLKRRIPTAYKVLAAVGCLALVSFVLVTNLFSLRSLVQNVAPVQTKLVNELKTTQDLVGGGFRNSTHANAVPDAWTSGQALEAVLLSGSYDAARIKQAFAYIEQERHEDGFDVQVGPGTTPFVRTEGADWIAIAYLQSLSSPGVWAGSERAAAVERTEKTLSTIVSQQAKSGGWDPVPSLVGHERTYATMMSVWALTEALLSGDISDEAKQSYGGPFEKGVNWLLTRYEDKLGWEEDPRYKLKDPYPGLTYQTLFVLERAQWVSGHNSFKDLERFQSIKRDIKDLVHPAEIKDVTSVPSTDIMIGNYPCWADVLAYPWLLSVAPRLIADPDVSPEDRRYLRQLLKEERAKMPELPSKLVNAETWKLAEQVIGISNVMNSQQIQRQ